MGRMTLCHFEAAVPFGTWSHARLTATLYIDPRCLVRDNQVGLCPGLQKICCRHLAARSGVGSVTAEIRGNLFPTGPQCTVHLVEVGLLFVYFTQCNQLL